MRKPIAILALSIVSAAAQAEWVGGAGYYNLSDDEGNVNVSLNSVAASIGYRFEGASGFFWMPELRFGIGVGDDTVLGVEVEIESLLAFSVRGQFDFESGIYVFGLPAYANLDVKASSGGFSASEDDWEFGYGGGVGFRFSDKVSGEVSYEIYDDTDVIGAAIKLWFR